MCDDPHEGLVYALRGQDLARQLGARYVLGISVLNAVLCLLRIGEWDRAAAIVEVAVEDDDLGDFTDVGPGGGLVRALRGDASRARGRSLPDGRGRRRGPQDLAYHAYALAVVCDAEGDASRPSATLGAPRRFSRPRRWTPSSSPGPSPSARRTSWATARLSTRCSPCWTVATTARSRVMVRAERRLAMARLVATPRSGWPPSRTP